MKAGGLVEEVSDLGTLGFQARNPILRVWARCAKSYPHRVAKRPSPLVRRGSRRGGAPAQTVAQNSEAFLPNILPVSPFTPTRMHRTQLPKHEFFNSVSTRYASPHVSAFKTIKQLSNILLSITFAIHYGLGYCNHVMLELKFRTDSSICSVKAKGCQLLCFRFIHLSNLRFGGEIHTHTPSEQTFVPPTFGTDRELGSSY
ncbi:hypothetical protein AVEN_243319-1 [Araneus ventricosus]|uniref:Uncharacterized protein n=1 Tax=Araneus ventricosus TaxID=182803 RepID=A0A4Y2VXX5_ARAVE|nr:hypothetical protein AVEN_243319-1 [Araneus ventricosus]